MVKEVQRRAVVGDTIKVINAKASYGLYHNGDVLKVERVIEDGVRAETIDGEATLWHSEYVVIEQAYGDMIANLSAEVVRLKAEVQALKSKPIEIAVKVGDGTPYKYTLFARGDE